MASDTSNLHLTNMWRTRAAVFGAGVSVWCVAVLLVSAISAARRAVTVSDTPATTPMILGTSVSRYMT